MERNETPAVELNNQPPEPTTLQEDVPEVIHVAPGIERNPRKRTRSSKFTYQDECYEQTMQLTKQLHELDVEMRKKQIDCAELEIELKHLNKEILAMDKEIKKCQLELLETQNKVWKAAGVAVLDAAVAVSSYFKSKRA